MSERPEPPVAKYRYTLILTGNSHDEIENELLSLTRGGYLLDSDYYKRDEFHVVGGRRVAVLECINPEQTPEEYDAALSEWFDAHKAWKRDLAAPDSSRAALDRTGKA